MFEKYLDVVSQMIKDKALVETAYQTSGGEIFRVKSHFDMNTPFARAIYPVVLFNIREQARQSLENDDKN